MVRRIVIFLIFTLSILAQDTSLVKSLKWRQVLANGHGQFPVKDGRSLVSLNGYLYMLGGWGSTDDGEQLSNHVYISKTGRNWRRIADNSAWSDGHCRGHLVWNNKIWIISGEFNDAVWSSPDGLNWTQEAGATFGARYSPYAAVFRDSLWLMGGQDFYTLGVLNPIDLNDVWKSGNGSTWTQVTASASWAGRGMIQGYTVIRDTLFLCGGERVYPEVDNGIEDVWKTGDGVTWTQVTADAEWTGKRWTAQTVYRGFMFMCKGRDPDEGGDSYETWFSQYGITWSKLTNHGFAWVSHANSVTVHDDKIYLVNGTGGVIRSDVYELKMSVMGIGDATTTTELTVGTNPNNKLYLSCE